MAYHDKATDKMVSVMIFLAIFVALVPTVLIYIGNLSTSGVLLAAATATIASILLGVFALKAIQKHLKA